MSSYIGSDEHSIQRSIVNHVEYTLGLTRFNFDNFGAFQATTLSIRDRLIESLNDTNEYFTVSSLFDKDISYIISFLFNLLFII
jgi:starch phosphorylase